MSDYVPINHLLPRPPEAEPPAPPIPHRRTTNFMDFVPIVSAGLVVAALLIFAVNYTSDVVTTAIEPVEAAQPTVEVQSASAPTLAYSIVAFDAPNGTPLGAIEIGREYTILEEYGDWMFLDVERSGKIWTRTYEFYGTPPPTPLPTAIPVVVPPRAQAPVIQAPAPAPVMPCQAVVEGDRHIGTACGWTSEARKDEALRILSQTPLQP
jgi:hypothetical protein